jgi:hypothetical protein
LRQLSVIEQGKRKVYWGLPTFCINSTIGDATTEVSQGSQRPIYLVDTASSAVFSAVGLSASHDAIRRDKAIVLQNDDFAGPISDFRRGHRADVYLYRRHAFSSMRSYMWPDGYGSPLVA